MCFFNSFTMNFAHCYAHCFDALVFLIFPNARSNARIASRFGVHFRALGKNTVPDAREQCANAQARRAWQFSRSANNTGVQCSVFTVHCSLVHLFTCSVFMVSSEEAPTSPHTISLTPDSRDPNQKNSRVLDIVY